MSDAKVDVRCRMLDVSTNAESSTTDIQHLTSSYSSSSIINTQLAAASTTNIQHLTSNIYTSV